MSDTPLISVIVPVYNVEKYLDRCIESVVSQTYANLEILLVDDGSSDHCPAMCDSWAARDPRIRVIHKKNGGPSDARNAGLAQMTGQYVMFVDSDDVLSLDICEELFHLLDVRQADIAICDSAHAFGNSVPEFSHSEHYVCYSPLEAIRETWYQRSFLPSPCGRLYKASLFTNIRFRCGIWFEDVDIMHLLFSQAQKIVYSPSRLYGYIHREGSITTSRFSSRDLDILPIAERLLSFANTQEPDLIPAAKAYRVTAALRVYLNAPHGEAFAEARKTATAILREDGKKVAQDPQIRNKTRYALLLYFYCRPVLPVVYKCINRWK